MVIPELLSPAGSPDALKAAVFDGCDAVYLGGKLFGARQYAANFSNEELKSAAVDLRHIMLVADIMCMDGEVKQIGRHGIAGEKESVLSRASFEVTVNHLLDAAVAHEFDELSGVTENVIVGQPILLGTGDVKLMVRRVAPQ